MPYTIALIHTRLRTVDLLNREFSIHLPHVRKFNILDETIFYEAIQNGLTPRVLRRLNQHFLWAEQMKADTALCTTSALEPAVSVCQKFVHIPLLRLNEPMCERALAAGHRICVLGTLHPAIAAVASCLQDVAARRGHTLHVITKYVPEAAEQLDMGDWDMHNRLFIQSIREVSGQCDVAIIAQVSLLPLLPALNAVAEIPVLGSAEPLIQQINRLARSRTPTPIPRITQANESAEATAV
ncbi:MAG: aspartate/glutamate racemase family protein [Candidatus Sumerlaeia bacterium]|nr:aspartate/glutamate racemase family protein [Candidatus Sumerlaeia bacterium]